MFSLPKALQETFFVFKALQETFLCSQEPSGQCFFNQKHCRKRCLDTVSCQNIFFYQKHSRKCFFLTRDLPEECFFERKAFRIGSRSPGSLPEVCLHMSDESSGHCCFSYSCIPGG